MEDAEIIPLHHDTYSVGTNLVSRQRKHSWLGKCSSLLSPFPVNSALSHSNSA